VWVEKADLAVAKTTVGGAEVSTVSLGLDHASGYGKPLLFETLVFGGALGGEMDRYATRQDALAGHENIVGRVRGMPQ
jgi:hypothetical protein